MCVCVCVCVCFVITVIKEAQVHAHIHIYSKEELKRMGWEGRARMADKILRRRQDFQDWQIRRYNLLSLSEGRIHEYVGISPP